MDDASPRWELEHVVGWVLEERGAAERHCGDGLSEWLSLLFSALRFALRFTLSLLAAGYQLEEGKRQMIRYLRQARIDCKTDRQTDIHA